MTLNMTAWGEEKRRVVSQAMITISLDNVEVLHCGRYIDIRAGNEGPRSFHNHGEGPYFTFELFIEH